LAGLDRWVRDGTAPPRAPRLSVDTSGPSPAFVRDEVGNVQGGIRPPVVEAPVDVLSGLPGSSPSVVCLLMGTTTPIPPDRLVTLHGSRDGYLAAYTEATDELIEAGFALAADRDEILADAAPARVG